MTKKTTSDFIKQALAQYTGTDIKEWKRRSKKKNGQGQWVREFEHAATGQTLAVLQTSETTVVIGTPEQMDKYNASAPQKASMTAEEFIDKLLEFELEEDDTIDVDREVAALGKDLAAQFVFAYYGKDEFCGLPTWYISPLKTWEEEGCLFDSHVPIHALLPPGAGEAMEAVWSWETDMTPADAAKDLLSRGFTWDKEFQESFSSDVETDQKDIEAVTKAMEALKGRGGPTPPKGPSL